MQVYKGVSASPGLVMGPIYRIHHSGAGLGRIVELPVREQALFDAAVVLAKDELRQLEEAAEGEDRDIILFQRVMLDDPALNREVQEYIAAGAGSAAAMERAAAICARRIESVDDEYIRQRSADVLDACRRVVNILDGRPRTPVQLEMPSILAGERIFPSDIVSVGRGMILGIAAAEGSVQSHAAIIARTMGIPAVAQLGPAFLNEAPLTRGILDADNGRLVVDPDREAVRAAQRRIVSGGILKKRMGVLKSQPCVTLDGTILSLRANCSCPEDIEIAMEAGAEGVGLLRSEFMIADGRIPGEEEQYYFYISCLQAAGGKPVTVRTFDIGSDKTVRGVSEPALNPALGMRGIRMSLARPQMFLDQVCALLRAAAKGPLQVMFPMITCAEDWRLTMELVDRAKAQLRQRGVPFQEDTVFGSMIEVPSAALLAPELAAQGCGFFSIGTNDLTQYTYAADRLDGRFSGYFAGESTAVHRLIDLTIAAAKQAGLPVCACGVSTSDPGRAVRYARQGVRILSMEASSILPVKAKLLEADLAAPETAQG
ncbi:phosphoenolpyruvate-protein phosphotransferase [Oscillospiraceae bacterium]|uniref:phosphoenolpyruvate--protein phosphotransferase n=1 Tax=Allofournierella sp. TaxID=1940256 RepID=UPI0015B33CF7|nr:phosphoenolpyruvate-protein phosphotransferase [Oscillospiraceae bacterium]